MSKATLSFIAIAVVVGVSSAIYLPNNIQDGQTYTYTQTTYENQGVPVGQVQGGYTQNVQYQNGYQQQGYGQDVYSQNVQTQQQYNGYNGQNGVGVNGRPQIHVTNNYVKNEETNKKNNGGFGLFGNLLGAAVNTAGAIAGAGLATAGGLVGSVLGGHKGGIEMAKTGAQIGTHLGSTAAQGFQGIGF